MLTKRMHRYVAISLVVLMGLLLVHCGGGGGDNTDREKQIASDVARQWTKEKVNEVSADIAEIVTDQITQEMEPGVTTSVVKVALEKMASSVIEDQITETIRWSYSEPEQNVGSQYVVVMRATVTITVPIPLADDKLYDGSLDFRLDVDTKNERVTDADMILSSVQFNEKEQAE